MIDPQNPTQKSRNRTQAKDKWFLHFSTNLFPNRAQARLCKLSRINFYRGRDSWTTAATSRSSYRVRRSEWPSVAVSIGQRRWMRDDPCRWRSARNCGDFVEERVEIEEMCVWGSFCCVGHELLRRLGGVNSCTETECERNVIETQAREIVRGSEALDAVGFSDNAAHKHPGHNRSSGSSLRQ